MGLVATGEASPILTQKNHRGRGYSQARRGNARDALECRRERAIESVSALRTGPQPFRAGRARPQAGFVPLRGHL